MRMTIYWQIVQEGCGVSIFGDTGSVWTWSLGASSRLPRLSWGVDKVASRSPFYPQPFCGWVVLISMVYFSVKLNNSICFTFTVKSKHEAPCCGTFRTDSFPLVQKPSFLFSCQQFCTLTLLSHYLRGCIGGTFRMTWLKKNKNVWSFCLLQNWKSL